MLCENVKKADMLSLLSPERLASVRPFSNPCEFFFPDRGRFIPYLVGRGIDIPERGMSDFEFFKLMWTAVMSDGSYIAENIKREMQKHLGNGFDKLEPVIAWSRAVDIFENKGADELFSFSVPEIGIALEKHQRNTELPQRLGEAVVVPVICPFGGSRFDIDRFDYEADYDNVESILSEFQRVAIFMGGFEFAEPNEYSASKAYEKKSSGFKLSEKESAILASQLCRKIIKCCANDNKEIMFFLPLSPDVYSMGQLSILFDYAEEAITGDKLTATVFAGDAVGMCFLSSLMGRRYKKITTVPGISGNGCGFPSSDSAEYWGISELPAKRASLSATPAFVGC